MGRTEMKGSGTPSKGGEENERVGEVKAMTV